MCAQVAYSVQARFLFVKQGALSSRKLKEALVDCGASGESGERRALLLAAEVQRAGLLEAEPQVDGKAGEHWRQSKAT